MNSQTLPPPWRRHSGALDAAQALWRDLGGQSPDLLESLNDAAAAPIANAAALYPATLLIEGDQIEAARKLNDLLGPDRFAPKLIFTAVFSEMPPQPFLIELQNRVLKWAGGIAGAIEADFTLIANYTAKELPISYCRLGGVGVGGGRCRISPCVIILSRHSSKRGICETAFICCRENY